MGAAAIQSTIGHITTCTIVLVVVITTRGGAGGGGYRTQCVQLHSCLTVAATSLQRVRYTIGICSCTTCPSTTGVISSNSTIGTIVSNSITSTISLNSCLKATSRHCRDGSIISSSGSVRHRHHQCELRRQVGVPYRPGQRVIQGSGLVQGNNASLVVLHLIHANAVHHQRQQEEKHRHQGQHMESRREGEVIKMVDQKQGQRSSGKQLNRAGGPDVNHAKILPQHHQSKNP
mmetsp:Transcript_25239/g.43467  ORF Transcript_25239/g.43467 Transcript_25239/m.43467 type:complete len:232 (+) Transcript_25239:51-746(+)